MEKLQKCKIYISWHRNIAVGVIFIDRM